MTPTDSCFTHKAPSVNEPWLAIHRESSFKLLKDYNLTESQKTNICALMAGYCNVLDNAGLLHFGESEGEAIMKACGMTWPNGDLAKNQEQPTPETYDNLSYRGELVIADFAIKFERDSLRAELETKAKEYGLETDARLLVISQLRTENDKLREMAERLSIYSHNHGNNPDASQRNLCARCCAIRDYRQLALDKENKQ